MGTQIDKDEFMLILTGEDGALDSLNDLQRELAASTRRRLGAVYDALDGSSDELLTRVAEHEAHLLDYCMSAINGVGNGDIEIEHLRDLASLDDNQAVAVFMMVTANAAKGIGMDIEFWPSVADVSNELIRRFADVENIDSIIHGCAYLTVTALAQNNPGPYEMTIQSRIEKRLLGLLV